MYKKIIALTFLCLITVRSFSQSNVNETKNERQYVVIVSLDAFRWDYPEKVSTPNFDYIASNGVKAVIIPSFPTVTFPNHYTMATGLYPDHHGIVQNSFYDSSLDEYYHLFDKKSTTNSEFYGGEPIWITAEKQDVTSASFYWVGSDVSNKESQPTYWKKYDHHFPFEQRIDTVIHWLSLPDEIRPHLILLYIHEPDGKGHKFGTESREVLNTITYLDSLVGLLINKINELPHSKGINLIVTSDHGMGDISPEHTIILDEYVKREWFDKIQGWNPTFNLKPKEEYFDTIYTIFKAIPHLQTWKVSEIPDRLHYGTNFRVMDMVILADSSWSVRWAKSRYYKATHGFDNRNTDMHAIFYAIGPAFKKNYYHTPFENVNLYPLISEILDLEPVKVDGKLENVSEMLIRKE